MPLPSVTVNGTEPAGTLPITSPVAAMFLIVSVFFLLVPVPMVKYERAGGIGATAILPGVGVGVGVGVGEGVGVGRGVGVGVALGVAVGVGRDAEGTLGLL
jgi:hypothetical protein